MAKTVLERSPIKFGFYTWHWCPSQRLFNYSGDSLIPADVQHCLDPKVWLKKLSNKDAEIILGVLNEPTSDSFDDDQRLLYEWQLTLFFSHGSLVSRWTAVKLSVNQELLSLEADINDPEQIETDPNQFAKARLAGKTDALLSVADEAASLCENKLHGVGLVFDDECIDGELLEARLDFCHSSENTAIFLGNDDLMSENNINPTSRPASAKSHSRFESDYWQSVVNIINSLPCAVWCVDANGRYTVANYCAFSNLNAQPLSLTGKTLAEIFPASQAMSYCDRNNLQVLKSGEAVLNVESNLSSGDNKWFRYDHLPLKNDVGELMGVMVIIADITDAKQKEFNALRAELSYRNFIANSSGAIFGAKLDRPMQMSLSREAKAQWIREYLRYTEANDSYARGLGVDCKDLLDKPVYPLASSRIEKYIYQLIDNNFSLDSILFSQRLSDGRLIWLELSAHACFDGDAVIEIWGFYQDVTERVESELELKRSEQRYRSFIQNSHDGIAFIELETRIHLDDISKHNSDAIISSAKIADCNHEFARQNGYDFYVDVVDLPLVEIATAEQLQSLRTAFETHDFQFNCLEVKNLSVSDREIWVTINTDAVIIDDYVYGFWTFHRDDTQRKLHLEELEYQANHDSLTNLPNRKRLYEFIDEAISKTDQGGNLALMLIDLDRFKEINDTLGHHVGDALLQAFAVRLENAFRDQPALVSRLGGDEFAVAVYVESREEGLSLAKLVLSEIQQRVTVVKIGVEIRASLGIAYCPEHGRDISSLMRFADMSMYQAKAEMLGIQEYDPVFDQYTHKRLALMNDLAQAIRDDGLTLFYQPKICLYESRLIGCEALLRWHHQTYGIVSPAEFIPLAEATDLIHPLTLWVIRNALRQCRVWMNEGKNITVAVNLSARNLVAGNLSDFIRDALVRYRVPAKNLELEITESAIMVDPKGALATLQELHDMGISLSIDDFGTGYSSLAYLKQLPVSTLKIDFSFVINMMNDEYDAVIVNSTVNLAHNLGLQVVAEGVETKEILNRLGLMNCDMAQGYFIGRPMTVENFEQWVRDSEWSKNPAFKT